MVRAHWCWFAAKLAQGRSCSVSHSYIAKRRKNRARIWKIFGGGLPWQARLSWRLAETELLAGFPFLELSLVDQDDFNMLVEDFFATDRHSLEKGLVEVIL
jgi:hypothetical protein